MRVKLSDLKPVEIKPQTERSTELYFDVIDTIPTILEFREIDDFSIEDNSTVYFLDDAVVKIHKDTVQGDIFCGAVIGDLPGFIKPIGANDDKNIVAFPRVKGENLTQRFLKYYRSNCWSDRDLDDLMRITKKVFTYMQEAYDKYEFNHFDLRLPNIMVDSNDEVTIIDYGASAVTYEGERIYNATIPEYGLNHEPNPDLDAYIYLNNLNIIGVDFASNIMGEIFDYHPSDKNVMRFGCHKLGRDYSEWLEECLRAYEK